MGGGGILGAINSKCKASIAKGSRQNKSYLRRATNTRSRDRGHSECKTGNLRV